MSSSQKSTGELEELGKCLTSNDTPLETSSMSENHLKNRILKTVCIYLGFLCLGMSQSVLGSAFADTENLLSTDTSHLSAAFTSNNIGYLAGSALCALIWDRFRPELQQALALILIAISTATALLCRNFTWFIIAMGLQGIGMAYVDSGTQAYCLSVWRGHRLQDAMIQGIFMAWSVGSTLCPFILQPFLSAAADSKESQVNTSCFQQKDLNSTNDVHYKPIQNITDTLYQWNNGNISHSVVREDNLVAYGYLTIGILIIPASIMYIIVHFFINKPLKLKNNNHKEHIDKIGHDIRKTILIGQFFVFFLVYVGLEVGFGGLLSLYVVRSFCLSNQKGALMTSLFWGSTGIGRLLGVPISTVLEPLQMLLGNILLIFAALIMMATMVHVHPAVLWCSVVSAGIGMATVYPSAYLWCSRYIKISGVATAVFNVGGSVGSMVLPLLTGLLIDIVSPTAFIYSMLAMGVSLVFLYAVVLAYTKCCMVEVKENKDPIVDNHHEASTLKKKNIS